MEFKVVHEDARGQIGVLTGLLENTREVTVFTTNQGYARGGCLHLESDEHCVVVKGKILYITHGKKSKILERGDIWHIPANTPHYFIALSDETVVMEWGPLEAEKKLRDPEWRKHVDRLNQLAEERPVRLHLGCGARVIPGFIHIDLAEFSHIDHKRDIGDLSLFKDCSVDMIYCSHALTYFNRVEIEAVLREWHRVLRGGGLLRLAVTDFEKVIEIYQKSNKLNQRGILGPLFGMMPLDGGWIFHKTVFDFATLRGVLKDCGFRNAQRYDWGETVHRDFDDCSQAYVPHMDKENGLLISLNVEALK